MAINTALCTSFKKELFEAVHDFTSDTFKIALYSSSASLDAATTAYSASNEISGTGYSAGGVTLSVVAPSADGTTGLVDFGNPSWSNATFSTSGALIYNSSKSNKAVAVYSFGSSQSVSSANFNITMPAAAAGTAIVRIN
jgi:hypothetical protein